MKKVSRRRRYHPNGEGLETRQLLSGSVVLSSYTPILAFAGVGFALNPIAIVDGVLNGWPDINPTDYKVQVNWGDGGGFSSQDIEMAAVPGLANNTDTILVKGSHVYQTPSTYPVTVMVTGPDNSSAETQTTTVYVEPMPSPKTSVIC